MFGITVSFMMLLTVAYFALLMCAEIVRAIYIRATTK